MQEWARESDMLKGSTLQPLPEKEVYTRLIDAYRLREDDDGGGPSIEGFRRFLDKAETARGGLTVLPFWWTAEKRKECENTAVDEGQWSYVNEPVDEWEITRHYWTNTVMVLQLRILGERIYDKPPKYPHIF